MTRKNSIIELQIEQLMHQRAYLVESIPNADASQSNFAMLQIEVKGAICDTDTRIDQLMSCMDIAAEK